MAFKPRNKNNSVESNEQQTSIKTVQQNTNTSPTKINSIEVIENLKTQNSDAKRAEYFKQEAIDAINEIEQKYGFDFYDENRVGGMHIGGKNRPINFVENEKNKFDDIVNNKDPKTMGDILSRIKNKKQNKTE